MKNDFKIGDLVTSLLDEGKEIVYAVTEVEEFEDFDTGELLYDYELVMIFPVRGKAMYFSNMEEENLRLHADRDSREARMIIDLIVKERMKLGIYGEPEFIRIIRENLMHAEPEYFDGQRVLQRQKQRGDELIKDVKDVTIAGKDNIDDKVFYSTMTNVNECLDAINDLKALHKNFGDQEYLDNLEIVKKRLKRII